MHQFNYLNLAARGDGLIDASGVGVVVDDPLGQLDDELHLEEQFQLLLGLAGLMLDQVVKAVERVFVEPTLHKHSDQPLFLQLCEAEALDPLYDGGERKSVNV